MKPQPSTIRNRQAADSPAKNSYDEVPYDSHPFSQTHPGRLATIARLFGMEHVPIEDCRVLELGCSMGGNLIPLAEQLPGSRFVGIDASAVEIRRACEVADVLQLKNVRLENRNILEVDEDFGEFDYIIAHGVYSWVSDEVQDHILRICRKNLSSNGVAYVSYNTYPGWRMRGMIRDMMCYRARKFEQPAERLRQSRALLDFLVQSVPREDNAYGILLKNELDQIRKGRDHYLLHEYLEEVNEPVYFYQFVERAAEHGLQYLGEADYRIMSTKNFPPQVESMLQSVCSDVVEIEQYMDFLRNRLFRQTLLCHESVSIDRAPAPDHILSMHVASPAKPEAEGPIDIHSHEKVTFRGPHSITSTTEPLVKAAMLYLSQMWPKSVPFATLFAVAQSRLNCEAVVVDTSEVTSDTGQLAEPLLRCYGTAHVELSVYAPRFTLEVPERPTVPRIARHQATKGKAVTNLRHDEIQLNDVQRRVLPYLDGSNDAQALTDKLVSQVSEGLLTVHDQGRPVSDPTRLRQILEESLQQNLAQLARMALICE
jgi:methyltransferase-like protein/SAM-dependent methyltransferase